MSDKEKDSITKKLFSNNHYFADVFNYKFFNGEKVINPEDLVEMDIDEIALLDDTSKPAIAQRHRDLLKLASIKKCGNNLLVLLGIENQTKIDKAMVPRTMLYDALKYVKQTEKTVKVDGKSHNVFSETNELIPVITLVIYYDSNKWTGARSLYDMFNKGIVNGIDGKLLQCINDYHMNIIEPWSMKESDMDLFETSISCLFTAIKMNTSNYSDDTRISVYSSDRFKHLDDDIVEAINILLDEHIEKDEKGGISMNNYWKHSFEEIKNEGIEQGRSEGIEQGRTEGMLTLIINLIKSGTINDNNHNGIDDNIYNTAKSMISGN